MIDRIALGVGEAPIWQAAHAVSSLTELLTDRLQILGPDHPDTLTNRHNLAHWQGQTGDHIGAATAFEQLLADRMRVLGPSHPHILATYEELAYWRQRRRGRRCHTPPTALP
jgi:hypothetical protein